MMETIQYVEQSCFACPTIFEVKLSDGTEAYIKFRWGWISLIKESPREEILSEKISDDFDGVISWKDTVKWLKSKNYVVQSS